MIQDSSRSTVRLGVNILPAVAGRQNPIFSAGWSDTDPTGFVWIDGAAGELTFDMPPVLTDLALELECYPMDLSIPSPQRVSLFCNGLFAGARLVRDRTLLSFFIPRDMATGKRVKMLLVPDVVEVPKLAGRNSDERALSVGVISLCLRASTQA